MKIVDKWVVHETRDDMYFTGMSPSNYPVLEHLNSRVRQYKSRRAAECAIGRIHDTGIEYCDFTAEYIEYADVQDVSEDPKQESLVLAEVKDLSGWEKVFAFAKPPTLSDELAKKKVRFADISLCRKGIANQEIFGVVTLDGKLYSAGIGGGETALKFFLEEYYKYLLPRVTRKGVD